MCWRKGTSVKATLAERGGVWEGSAVVSSIGTLFLELWVSGVGRGEAEGPVAETGDGGKAAGLPWTPPEA